ncbi:MAG TPA: hypothetical protein VGU68_13430 [Ktedonobacteraceae bacterium]|nr:hypothetical protein [Ktedonobacteraceae bacterium]
MTVRVSLSLLLLLALVAWGVLVLFTHLVSPDTALAFFAFFIILTIALTSTLTPLAYAISRALLAQRPYRPTLGQSLREGMLLALAIVLNLLLLALHSWNIFTALASLAAAVVLEVLLLARK